MRGLLSQHFSQVHHLCLHIFYQCIPWSLYCQSHRHSYILWKFMSFKRTVVHWFKFYKAVTESKMIIALTFKKMVSNSLKRKRWNPEIEICKLCFFHELRPHFHHSKYFRILSWFHGDRCSFWTFLHTKSRKVLGYKNDNNFHNV